MAYVAAYHPSACWSTKACKFHYYMCFSCDLDSLKMWTFILIDLFGLFFFLLTQILFHSLILVMLQTWGMSFDHSGNLLCRQTNFPKHFKVDWWGAYWEGKWCYYCSGWKQNRPRWQEVTFSNRFFIFDFWTSLVYCSFFCLFSFQWFVYSEY